MLGHAKMWKGPRKSDKKGGKCTYFGFYDDDNLDLHRSETLPQPQVQPEPVPQQGLAVHTEDGRPSFGRIRYMRWGGPGHHSSYVSPAMEFRNT